MVLALLADKATNGSVTRPRLCRPQTPQRPQRRGIRIPAAGGQPGRRYATAHRITTLVIDWLSADEAAASPTQTGRQVDERAAHACARCS